jgi:hypothetical protein
MKERPILFSAPMVRAIQAGTKTQTRRVVKSVGRDGGFVLVEQESGAYWPYRSDDGETTFVTVRERGDEYLHEIPMCCPYGAPGDRLWARETWAQPGAVARSDDPVREDGPVVYRADGESAHSWRPSIHMPRWASRITLEVTGVRVERLQDISGADAIAEGIERDALTDDWSSYGQFVGAALTPKGSYRALWDSINGTGSWDANPWVWVVEFRVL